MVEKNSETRYCSCTIQDRDLIFRFTYLQRIRYTLTKVLHFLTNCGVPVSNKCTHKTSFWGPISFRGWVRRDQANRKKLPTPRIFSNFIPLPGTLFFHHPPLPTTCP